MESQKNITFAYNVGPYNLSEIFGNGNESFANFKNFLSWGVTGQFILAFEQYLKYAKKLDRVTYIFYDQTYKFIPNSTNPETALIINSPDIDIWIPPYRMSETLMPVMDFSYPISLLDYMFVTRKPKYRPQIFGIFQTFSLPVWITTAFVFLAMLLVHHIILKCKCNFAKILFHVFAVLMKQGSAIAPSSLGEKILVHSWILGCMILCLSYESVFLSFLSFPPVTKIKLLSELALAVQKGDIQCMSYYQAGVANYLLNTNDESLKVIATDILKNNLSYGFTEGEFLNEKKKNYALFIDSHRADHYREKFFVSEDRFMKSLFAFGIQKNFSFRDLLNIFIHRMMASGIFFKYKSEVDFWRSFYYFSQEQDDNFEKRKLTLTDLAPAFIFLLSGYTVSFIVLIGEILFNKKKVNQSIKRKMKRKRKVHFELSV